MSMPTRFCFILALVAGAHVAPATVPNALAQPGDWERYDNAGMNVGFSVPPDWIVTIEEEDGLPVLTATSPDESAAVVVYSFKEAGIQSEQLLDDAIADLEGQVEGVAQGRDINGLSAWVAEAQGVIDGEEVALVVMAANNGDDNHVAYGFSSIDSLDQNGETLRAVMASFAPAGGGAVDPGPSAGEGAGFVVTQPANLGEFESMYQDLMQTELIQSVAAELNDNLVVPVRIGVGFDTCGGVNAFYNPAAQQITMCFELVQHLATRFTADSPDGTDVSDALIGAMVFVLFHEVGHALVDVLQLPITGREEDAVDQLATFVLADGTDEGEQSALDGARWFFLEAQDSASADLAFWGEHSLNQQRFYNVLCWVYGQAQEKYGSLITDGILPEDRAQRCPGEFEQIDRAWQTLLEPHYR